MSLSKRGVRRVRQAYRARRDFIDITDHYAAKAPHSPFGLLGKIDEITQALTTRARPGPEVEKTLFHKKLVTGTKYILLYRVTKTEIMVGRVVHGARDWLRL